MHSDEMHPIGTNHQSIGCAALTSKSTQLCRWIKAVNAYMQNTKALFVRTVAPEMHSAMFSLRFLPGPEARGGVMQILCLQLGGCGNSSILPGVPEAMRGVMQPLGLHLGEWGNASIFPGAPEAKGGVMQPLGLHFGG